MGKCFVNPTDLLAVAGMLAAIAKGEPIGFEPCQPTRRTQPCGCGRPIRPVCPPPAPRWGVCECEPREDRNKVFGINVRVDEPRAEDYASRWAFERDHAKFDRLVDAAEACTWANKSNTAPLHRVNAIRKRIQDGPVFNRQLIGETHWF